MTHLDFAPVARHQICQLIATVGDGLDRKATSSDAEVAGNGLAGNLVSAIRSFLPGGKPPEPQIAHGKKPVKVQSLPAAAASALGLHVHTLHTF